MALLLRHKTTLIFVFEILMLMLFYGEQERLFHDRLLQGVRRGAARDRPTRALQDVYKTVTRGRSRDLGTTRFIFVLSFPQSSEPHFEHSCDILKYNSKYQTRANRI